jgi:hypothetical protein
VTDERRRHPRVAHPLEAKWSGSSGTSPCRIADISLGGCFVQALVAPTVGEATTLTVQARGAELVLEGTVLYTEPSMGFGVSFQTLDPDQLERLRVLIDELQKGAP